MAARGLPTEIFQDDDLWLLAKAVHDFGERELVPYLRELGKEEFPDKFLPLAAASGFLGTAIPSEFGGQGGTLQGFLPVIEGIAAYDGSLALTLAAHESLATTHVLLGGSDEQKRKYLPALATGRNVGAWCLTEPQAGSNIFNDMRAKLSRTSQGWILSGEKTFITNGCHADLYVAIARAIGQGGQDAGITACVVERQGNQNGITSTPLHGKMGMWRTDTATVKFDNVFIAEDFILGPVGSAGQVARCVLLRGRIGVAALVLGLARDSLERATSYTKTRNIGKATLFEQQLTRAKLSGMEESLWAAWQAVRSAARLADQSQPFKVQACMAKVFASETALRIADEAIQLLGGYGYMRDYKVEQNYRDARLLTIGEGASEILRLAIARNLGEPGFGGEDLMPSLASLESDAGLRGRSASSAWGPSHNAFQLASDSFRIALDQIKKDEGCGDLSSGSQSTAIEVADLSTKLWVAGQVIRSGAQLDSRGTASGNILSLAKSFLMRASIEVCHEAMDLLRANGQTDERLLSNYAAVIQIAARNRSAASTPLLYAERP
ncbi:MAG: acyl-CoA dehydrogenase family protein [Terriglobia bacterium]